MTSLISELMSRPTVTVSDDASVERAREICRLHDVHFLVVLRDGAPCGTTCSCDLGWSWAESAIGEVMLRPAVAVHLTQSAEVAAELMSEHKKGCLVVLDAAGRLSGVVTRRDLIESGQLRGARGVDACVECGDAQHLLPVDCPGAPAFCGACLAQSRRVSPGASSQLSSADSSR